MRILNAAALVAVGVVALSAATTTAWAAPQCTDLGGTLDATTCRIHAATDAYKLDASYPTDYADQQALTDYLTQTRDGFVNVSQMPGSRTMPYELEVKAAEYRSARAPHPTQSAVLEVFQDVGGPRPLTWYKAFNYNLDARRPITFDGLFAPGTNPLGVIYPIVERELQRQNGLRWAATPGDGLDPVHYQNFAITDDELIFFFGQGEMMPMSAGAMEAHVPRDAVAAMLAP
jgi:hypothetical protein